MSSRPAVHQHTPPGSGRKARRSFSYLAVAAVLGLGLGACGGDDDGSTASVPSVPDDLNVPELDIEADDDLGETAPAEDVADPVALLPLEARTPSGFRQLPAKCDPGFPQDPERRGSGEADDGQDGEVEYSTWITYAVPEEWGTGGHGSAGSGGVTGTDEDRSFDFDPENSAKGRLEVEVNWASVDEEGRILDSAGEVSDGFDYESKIGDDEVTITYENVATVTVGDQETDLFYMDPTQAPEHVSSTEYRAHLDVMELPWQLGNSSSRMHSVVVVISFDAEQNPVAQETVEKILGSFTLPACTWERTLLDQEMIAQVDLNGDGHIRTPEEAQAELQEMLDEIQQEVGQP